MTMHTDRTSHFPDARYEMLQYAIDAHAIVAITDPAGVITYVNDKFCEISKYSRDELLGQTHRIINSGYHPKSFFVDMWSTISKGDTWRGEVRNRAKDGSIYWVDTTIVPFVDDAGKVTQHIAIRADITDRKAAESSLALHKYAIDAHAIVAITDPSGVITYVNDKFCEISKYGRDELLGQTHKIINSGHHPKSFFVEMWSAISKGDTWRAEICNRAKDGSIYWVDTTIVPFVNEAGKITQHIAIRADITDRKEAENHLRRANEELESFVYTASHDLKSPLLTIQGFSSNLRSYIETADYESCTHCTDRIQAAVNRMKSNVDDLLELSRIGRTEVVSEEIDLRSLIDNVLADCESMIQQSNANISINADIPTICGNPTRINQLLQNMLSNALKYGQSENESLKIAIDAREDNNQVTISLADNGPGIPEQYRAKVFELFHRLDTSSDGTGVGLNIIKRVAEVHGGSAHLDTTPGGGLTIKVTLPQPTIGGAREYLT
ncbi:MAG: hypothetical protein Phyf2KO_11320 [Phycisphaerales bacterium]